MRQPRYRAAIRAGRISELPSKQLHGIYGKFLNLWQEQGELSRRQNWLWDRVGEELAWRWRNASPIDRCHCQFCLALVELPAPYEGQPELPG